LAEDRGQGNMRGVRDSKSRKSKSDVQWRVLVPTLLKEILGGRVFY